MKRFFLLIFLVISVLFFVACNKSKDKTFYQNNLSITLTKEFSQKEKAGYDFYASSKNNTVMINVKFKENIFALYGELSLLNYMKLVLMSNGVDSYIYTHMSTTQPFYYAYYTTYYNNIDDYGFMMVLIENGDYYYIVNLVADYDVFEASKPTLMQWAMTISFNN